MAPQSVTSAMSSDDYDHDYLSSSPDPLAGSIGTSTKTKSRRKPARATKTPLGSTSPSKQNRHPSIAEQVMTQFSSPSKSMVLSTGRSGDASPWRIKVTVEAEPGSDSNMESPLVKHMTRTKTTTVPLKDPDASSPVKRVGRPRKSDAANSTKSKRSGTPVRRNTTPKEQRSSGGAGNADVEFADISPKKRPGRPRKSVQVEDESRLDFNGEQPTARFSSDVGVSNSAPKRRGRPRKSIQPISQDHDEDEDIFTGAAASISPEVSEAADALIDITPKKRRARPRKNQLAREDADILDVIEDLADTTSAISVLSQTEVTGVQIPAATPQSAPNSVVSIIQTTLATPPDPQPKPVPNQTLNSISLLPPKAKEKSRRAKLMEYDEPTVFTPPQTELSQRLRARKGTPVNKGTINIEDESDEEDEIDTPSATDEEDDMVESSAQNPQHHVPEGHFADSLLQAVVGVEAAESSEAEAINDADDDCDELDDVTNFAFDEGTTRMVDDSTILESENFSMISVDSFLSHGSPPNANTTNSPAVGHIDSLLDHSHVQAPSNTSRKTYSSPHQSEELPPTTSTIAPVGYQAKSSTQAPPKREQTPLIDTRCPSNPPSIVSAHISSSNTEAPRLGQVVKAGVALQGVLDPNRITPTAQTPKNALEKQRDGLDDLFRGFSERTRKELQDGLRLGEQLAQQNPAGQGSSLALSSPCKVPVPAESSDDIFRPRASSRASRLLTPEDQAEYTLPHPPSMEDSEIHYPTLEAPEQDSHLISPARSEDEMSWKADTPQAQAIAASKNAVTMAVHDNQDDFSDIWQEEASRSKESLMDVQTASEKTPQLQDFLDNDGPIKSARGKLPKTWRRKSSNDFHYSDEAEPEPEPEQQTTTSATGSYASTPAKLDKGKGKAVASPIIEQYYGEDDEDNSSEASDDTGMFFQSNLPSVFNKTKTVEQQAQTTEKLDLSLLLAEGNSLLPESSPVVSMAKTPAVPNPFKNNPPRFAALQSSPVKSSPLRRELRASDLDSSSRQSLEESSMLPQSSPFRTMIDDDQDSMGSDQRQFRVEFEGQTNSSIRNVRNEADEYLQAYVPQDRTLGDVEEVTEQSHSYQTTMLPSSPPQVIKPSSLAPSSLAPRRTYAPLFENVQSTAASSSNARSSNASVRDTHSARPQSSTPIIAKAPPSEETAQDGIFTRLTTSLWGALGTTAPPSPHPIVARYNPLPKVEPWTKTHYKTLDTLYQLHKNQPVLFAPSKSSKTSNTNNALLDCFQRQHGKKDCKYVGARFSSWGYSITLTESLVVICAVYMQLLTLNNIADYEQESGKKIEMGDCGPGPVGTPIEGYEVVRRLATVIMGEQLRRDERRGKQIRREGGMSVVWPK
ncbi:hypothetical protein K504DRAFT_459645 [Pleomassaria siparia CBS 279.74]|uniref:Uncharacterized protein n=1 Tax=Pleomassaria siparia CBS 279.74 TaxID=1314801 RepID=A0A6G1K1T4_9PLEO|nr:hypothetical protein K504DRAFT_459645 [Pleomassaria siparia CBS 279.74]